MKKVLEATSHHHKKQTKALIDGLSSQTVA